MKRSLVALAFGTLALGIAEFAMMGILPYVAQELSVTIAEAGHFISAYALGVCCGAPFLIVLRNVPLKKILLGLAVLIIAGNLGAAFSATYHMLFLARFVSGLPHGAYFGVATIAASKLAEKGKTSQAVSVMIAGMTVANLLGVPFATSLSHVFSWRGTFFLVAVWGVVVYCSVWKWIPHLESEQKISFREQFLFLKTPAPWLILGTVILGNGGVFCWYSYISPMLTNISGFEASSITWIMVLAGFGMVTGNLLSGRLSDRFTPGIVCCVVLFIVTLALTGLYLFAADRAAALILMTVCTAGLFAVSAPEQWLIIKVAPNGEMLAGSCVQIAFNFGNALGAYFGGMAVTFGYEYPALVGVPFTAAGFLLFFIFYRFFQKQYL